MALPTAKFNASLWGKIMSARFPEDYREVKDPNVTGQSTVESVGTRAKVALSPEEVVLLLLDADAEVDRMSTRA